jgi:hypothetical protein
LREEEGGKDKGDRIKKTKLEGSEAEFEKEKKRKVPFYDLIMSIVSFLFFSFLFTLGLLKETEKEDGVIFKEKWKAIQNVFFFFFFPSEFSEKEKRKRKEKGKGKGKDGMYRCKRARSLQTQQLCAW